MYLFLYYLPFTFPLPKSVYFCYICHVTYISRIKTLRNFTYGHKLKYVNVSFWCHAGRESQSPGWKSTACSIIISKITSKSMNNVGKWLDSLIYNSASYFVYVYNCLLKKKSWVYSIYINIYLWIVAWNGNTNLMYLSGLCVHKEFYVKAQFTVQRSEQKALISFSISVTTCFFI